MSAGSLAGNVTDDGGFNIDEAGTATLSRNITGTGLLTENGGIAILAGTESYSGSPTIGAAGTLQLGNGATTGSIAGNGNVTDSGVRRSDITEYKVWFSAANQGAPALGSVTDKGTAIAFKGV